MKCLGCNQEFSGYTKSHGLDNTFSSRKAKFCSMQCFRKNHKAPKTVFKNGSIPWNKGMKGSKPWYNTSGFNKDGFHGKHTQETKEKISKAKKDCIAWNKGKSAYWVKGEKNSNWKGGITKEDRLQRVRFRKTIQKSVFERDNYTCQMCGAKGVDLQVDHIQSWAEYIELRFNINNCRTLCAKCHYYITFGRQMPSNVKGWGHHIFLKGVD